MSRCHVVNVHRYVFEVIVGIEFTRGIYPTEKNEHTRMSPRFCRLATLKLFPYELTGFDYIFTCVFKHGGSKRADAAHLREARVQVPRRRVFLSHRSRAAEGHQ